MSFVVISIVPIVLLAGLFVCFLCADVKTSWSKRVLVGCLAFGLSIGISSLCYFLGMAWIGTRSAQYPFELALALGGSAALAATMYRRRATVVEGLSVVQGPTVWLSKLVGLTFLVSLGTALLRFAVISKRIPHGRGDARSIWNLRARFFDQLGDDWMTALDPRLTHVDYPLLLPASVARLWADLGSETTLVPQLIALGFTCGIVGVVVSTLSIIRSPSQGWLAGLVLLGGQFLVFHGASQNADTPLALFIVSTLAVLALYDCLAPRSPRLLILAGICAGLAAWTKNEGSLFLLCLGAARAISVSVVQGWRAMLRQSLWLVLGALVPLLCLCYFKVLCPVSNKLVGSQGWEATYTRLTDGSRYSLIFSHLMAELGEIPNLLPVVLLVYLVLVGGIPRRVNLRLAAAPLLCLALMSIGYYLVYLTTPYDLKWHLSTSLIRLLLHLLPSLILTLFVAIGTIEERYRIDDQPTTDG